jgi:hypothetical protein
VILEVPKYRLVDLLNTRTVPLGVEKRTEQAEYLVFKSVLGIPLANFVEL